MPIALSAAQTFVLILLRSAGLLMVAPILGETEVPARVRLGLAVVLSAAFATAVPPVAIGDPSVSSLILLSLRETLLGLAAGLGSRLVFESASAIGYLAGTAMGIGFGAAAGSGSDSPAVSQLTRVMSLMALVGLGAHREAIAWLYGSFQTLPPGGATDLPRLVAGCASCALLGIALTVRLVFPILGATLLGYLAMGIAGRAAPQINLSSVGFSTAILAGGIALYFTAPAIAHGVATATLAARLP